MVAAVDYDDRFLLEEHDNLRHGQNAAAAEWELTTEEMDELNGILGG